MDSLFGIPMNSIMVAMLVLLGIALLSIAFTALRNRVMFIVGLRNIPRRVAQTVLIIIGLMLSTLIISAAFTTGDTVDHSITKTVYDTLGHVDEIIEFESVEGGQGFAASDVTIPLRTVDELEVVIGDDPDIDGIAPMLIEAVPAVNEQARLSVPSLNMMGLDPTRMDGFPDVISLDGEPLDMADLAEDQVYLNESAAEELNVQTGDTVTIYFENQPLRFRVAAIVKDKVATGATGTESQAGMAARLETLQSAFSREGDVDLIAVSNRGGVRDSVALSDTVTQKLEQAIEGQRLDLAVEETKKESLEFAEAFGNGIMTFFIILGLFSIAAGILLIIMIFVMLAAERKTEMGISRAVGTKRRHLVQIFMSEGMGYNMMSALVGVILGVLVALALTGIMAALFSEFGLSIEPNVTARSLIISYSVGIVLTFITVVFASWRASNLNIVRAIRDLPEPPARPRLRSFLLGAAVAILGGLMMFAGIAGGQGFPYTLGFSLVLFGLAIALRYLRLPERPLFTAIGMLLLLFWLLGAGGRLPDWLSANRELDAGGMEMFFLSGIVMVAASTFVLVYNADLLLHVFTAVGGRLGRILPAVKTAVAYPLASKFRTGMTLAMIALVVFALTMMSTMNANFNHLFLTEEARGGWDIEVDENPNNPLGDLRQALAEVDSVDTSQFTTVGRLGVARTFATELRQEGQDDFKYYMVKGADDEFLGNAGLGLQVRAKGYADDEAVWEAVRTGRNLAIIDVNAIPQDFAFGGFEMFSLDGIDYQTTEFDPVTIEVRDDATSVIGEVQLVGVLDSGASGSGPFSSFSGLITSQKFIQEVFGGPDYSLHFIRLENPDLAKGTAQAIEAALFTAGAQAVSIKAEREDEQRLFKGFFYLMQAFMGLGLVVGIAAVGVIAFRTVVERRQQIGMLRAIGYTRGTVALSFLMESSFVTLLGIASGLGLGILLSYFIMTSDEFTATGIKSFYVPWLELIFISLFAYLASLIMTFIPSRQAASIPIAEALRYE